MTAVPTSYTPWTLEQWRHAGNQPEFKDPRVLWTPLEPFFLSLGYELWLSYMIYNVKPPNKAPRTPDGFAYMTPYNEILPDNPSFSMTVSLAAFFTNAILVTARSRLPSSVPLALPTIVTY
jgi:hypothetical protein